MVVALALAGAGCSRKGGPAEQAAAHFVDTYYVRIDPKGALALSSGAALEKLEKELLRLAGVGPVDAADRPQIRAALRGGRTEGNSATFSYEIQSISDGVQQLTVDVDLAAAEGRWLVTDFREREQQ